MHNCDGSAARELAHMSSAPIAVVYGEAAHRRARSVRRGGMARNEAMSTAKPRIDGHEVSGEAAWRGMKR